MRWLITLALLTFILVPFGEAAAFPQEYQWEPVMIGSEPLWDPAGDVGGGRRDIVGNDEYPAGYFFQDPNGLYLRMRLAEGPGAGENKFHPTSGWGVALEYDGDYSGYEAMIWLNGANEQLSVYANTVSDGTHACEEPDEEVFFSVNPDLARMVQADSALGGTDNYFVDVAVPTEGLEAVPPAADGSRPIYGTTIQFIFGTGDNNPPQFTADIAGTASQPPCDDGEAGYVDLLSDDVYLSDDGFPSGGGGGGSGGGADDVEDGEDGQDGANGDGSGVGGEDPPRIVADTPEEAAALAAESNRECLWVIDHDHEGEGTAYVCETSWLGGGAMGCTSVGDTGRSGPAAVAVLLFVYFGVVRRRRSAWLLPLLLLIPVPLWGMDTERYQATPSPMGWIAVDQFDVLAEGDISAGFFPRFAKNPVVYREDGNITRRVVSGRLSGDLVGSMGVFPRVEIGAAIPTVLYQTGNGFFPDEAARPTAISLGDIRLRPRIALLSAEDTGADWGLTFTPALHLPTSREGALAGASGVGFHPELAGGGRIGPWSLAANLGAALRREETQWGVRQGNKLLYKAAVGWQVPIEHDIIATAELLGETAAQRPFSGTGENPLEWMGGAMGEILPGLSWHAGVGTGLLPGLGSPTFRAVAGIRWTTGNNSGPFAGAVRASDVGSLAAVGRDRIELGQTVNFYSGQEVIDPDSYDLLDAVAEVMHQSRRLRIRIVGHTDNVGAPEMNEALSLRRAQAVADYLVGQGVARDRLQVEGRGESEPIADNATAGGREENRRVEFLVE